MLADLKQSVDNDVEWAQKRQQAYLTHKAEIKAIARSLLEEEVGVTRASMNETCLDLSIAGDFSVLKATFRALRKLGYEPGTRPESRDPSFSTYFDKVDSELRLWLSFSSTICKRVQVGTEMKEVPIYETVCE